VPSDVAKKRAKELLELMDLSDRANDPVEDLSSGMKMKVILARALIHDPPILFLDEPTIGLDPGFSQEIRKFIKNVLNREQGKTILLTTHYMDEADFLCDRIAMMSKGKIIKIDTPEALKMSIKEYDIIHFDTPLQYTEEIVKILEQNHLFERYENEKSARRAHFKIFSKNGLETMDYLISETQKRGIPLVNFRLQEPTLEDVFIKYTGKSLEEEEDED